MDDGEVLFPAAKEAPKVNATAKKVALPGAAGVAPGRKSTNTVGSTLKNWRFWVMLITLFVSTLVVYSDVFISDVLAKFPSLVNSKDKLNYQTNCKGALLQGTVLVTVFAIAYIFIYAIL